MPFVLTQHTLEKVQLCGKGDILMKVIPYDREKAVDYAHKWAFGRNPAYYNYDDIGGDCTNFASQTLRAGGGVMNTTPTFGWYYYSANNKSPSWTGVQYLYNFLTTNKGVGPFGHDAPISLAQPGDIIQLSFRSGQFQHSPVIVSVGEVPSFGNILIAAHTFDADNRPLFTYNWDDIRLIHIDGIRTW